MPVTESAGGKDFTQEIQEALVRRVGRDAYRLWFGQMVQCRRETREVIALIASQFALDRIGSRYIGSLRDAVQDVCGDGTLVRLELASSSATSAPAVEETSGDAPKARRRREAPADGKDRHASAPETQSNEKPLLQLASVTPNNAEPAKPAAPKQNWDSIVQGKSNKLAITAARMICDEPGSASPLFVWGPTGSGKSLLLSVIANQMRLRHRMRRVISMTAEEFTNDFIGSVTGSGLPGFRRRYRDVDALIIDQVQFLPGKAATSREMMYTIDSVQRRGKQIIFAADQPPMEIANLGSDLAGRMSSGMVCAIGPQDHQMRTEILRRNCKQHAIEIDDDILSSVAMRVMGDGRLLSGVACRLKALMAMNDGHITQADTDEALIDLISSARPAWGFEEIQEAVCSTMGLAVGALRTPGQGRNVSQARMLAMYLAREHTGATFGEIGEYFGGRSHSAVIAATKRIAGDVNVGKEFKLGRRTVPVRQMLDTVESILRTG